MLLLLVLIGTGRIMCQIEAKEALNNIKLAIVDVEEADSDNIKAGMSILLSIHGVLAERNFPVSKEGTVNLPYIGKLMAAGRSEAELKADIKKAYVDAGILEPPPISVIGNIIGHQDVPPLVHVGGQVRKPGPIDFAEGMTIGDAIKAVGGATEFGSLKRVKIFRDGKMAAYENRAVPLKKNDTIEVPQKNLFGE